ncbi:hypothetical protein BZA03_104163 [Alteromonas sp. I10]|uniref:hypothetical protein n=1 Tax=Alteromonas TaxID=226 RepID=UPI000D762291|nr:MULTISPECIES: hypothetical protein [Alteromonas]PXW74079.1 hypothetical protein BZA03_104163 [Alteromonas sp. I10]
MLKYYFAIYGGWPKLFKSSYFWISVIITSLFYPTWSKPEWWGNPLDILPNILGFSLGGYALIMAFGDKEFLRVLSYKNSKGETSAFMDLNAAFVHFIVLQIFAIILALLSENFFLVGIPKFVFEWNLIYFLYAATYIWYFLSYLTFIYALITTFAATFAILRVMKVYSTHLNIEK